MTRFWVSRSERGCSGMRSSCGHEPRLAGEQFLHHGLLDSAGLFAPLFQCSEFGVHVGEHGGDSGLFGERWKRAGDRRKSRTSDMDNRIALSTTGLLLVDWCRVQVVAKEDGVRILRAQNYDVTTGIGFDGVHE